MPSHDTLQGRASLGQVQNERLDKSEWGLMRSSKKPPNPVQLRQAAGITGESVLQRLEQQRSGSQVEQRGGTASASPPNNTGLPDTLKSGIEALSGMSMDDVKVHYNSSQPAQFKALAYAQGTDIHVAPGQEQHLAHEAWHVVQQKQGRVAPTLQMKGGVAVNDDDVLEREADMMGARAANMQCTTPTIPSSISVIKPVIQYMKIGIDGGRLRNFDRELTTAIDPESLQYLSDALYVYLESEPDLEERLHRFDRFVVQLERDENLEELEDILEVCLKRFLGGGRTFSGLGRATEAQEERADEGAGYATGGDIPAPTPLVDVDLYGDGSTFLTIEGSPDVGQLTVTARHMRPWRKGSRSPSQSGAMGGWSAKNYMRMVSSPDGGNTPGDVEGKYEWLHLVGSSLGGVNLPGNLVAGSYDANTEMIPFEQRVAVWKNKEPFVPVQITVSAALVPGTYIAQSIDFRAERTDGARVEHNVSDSRRRLTVTKDEYKSYQEEASAQVAATATA